MTEEERKIWLNLIEISDIAYDYAPWQYVKENQFLAFINDKNEMWYASVLGSHNQFHGIIFIQDKDINKYLEIYKNNFSAIQTYNYQIGYMISFIKAKELKDDELNLYRQIGIKFNDIAFRFQKFEKGYLPHLLNNDEASVLFYLLNNFIMIFNHLERKTVLPPEDGEMLTRFYSIKDHNYQTANIKFFTNEEKYDIIPLDSFDISDVKGRPIELEFDFTNYLPIAIGTNYEDGKYRLNKYFALADSIKNKMINIEVIDDSKFENEMEYNKEMINKLIQFIKNNYIPKRIIVRDNYAYNLLKEFERISGIEVRIDKIRVIDVFVDSFMKGKK